MKLKEQREFYEKELIKLYKQFETEEKKNTRTKLDLIKLIQATENRLEIIEMKLLQENYKSGLIHFSYAPDGIEVNIQNSHKMKTVRDRKFMIEFRRLAIKHGIESE